MSDRLVTIALFAYLGEKCVCGEVFNTIESLRGDNVIFWPREDSHGAYDRVAHRECWVAAGSPAKRIGGQL